MANEFLRELGNPPLPIDPYWIALEKGWKVEYAFCGEADGLTCKVMKKSGPRYAIFINDRPNLSYPEDTIYRRDRWTLAHEIAHIIMHPHHEWNNIAESELKNKLEVEANWFASRLLMPDYGFNSVMDLTTAAVVAKFDVNRKAAEKRLKHLDFKVRERLTKEVALFFNWHKPQTLVDGPIPDEDIFLMEVAAAAERNRELRVCDDCQEIMQHDSIGYICFNCGKFGDQGT
ncbi:ImmA/IrrE family metallo-endopeptidase [Paenibacillus humicus]|uniref:ImmA/IrrE family metallo-endopeptidase n=1 Tax=Paenibacillus humicus TaxID=412861 RepID=UPI003F163B24